jgi:hypothetical protein
MTASRPVGRSRRPRLDPEDEQRLLAAEEYRNEIDYLHDDYPAVPFEPGDYTDGRRR